MSASQRRQVSGFLQMKRMAGRILIRGYQDMPEWIIRNLVFFSIGMAMGLGFIFLFLRPSLRRFRRVLGKLKR